VDHVLTQIAAHGIETVHIRAREINPQALLQGRFDDPEIKAFSQTVAKADGVIIATPIFKAAYSGLLKAALDVLPQFGFAGKILLPLGTGGSLAHVLALDYALRPVLQSMGARHVVQAQFVLEQDIIIEDGGFTLAPGAEGALGEALRNFLHSLSDRRHAPLLGHPRPPTEAVVS